MSEAVRYVSSLAGLEYKVEPDAVALAPASVAGESLLQRNSKSRRTRSSSIRPTPRAVAQKSLRALRERIG